MLGFLAVIKWDKTIIIACGNGQIPNMICVFMLSSGFRHLTQTLTVDLISFVSVVQLLEAIAWVHYIYHSIKIVSPKCPNVKVFIKHEPKPLKLQLRVYSLFWPSDGKEKGKQASMFICPCVWWEHQCTYNLLKLRGFIRPRWVHVLRIMGLCRLLLCKLYFLPLYCVLGKDLLRFTSTTISLVLFRPIFY